MADVELYRRMYEVCKAAFDEESERVEFYDRKAQIVFGVSGIMLAFLIGQLESVVSILTWSYWLPWISFAFYILSVLVLFLAVLSGARAIAFRNYETYPESTLLLKTFSSEKEVDLLASMAHHFAKTTAANEISNRIRAAFVNRSMKCLRAGIAIVLIFMGFYVSGRIHEGGTPARAPRKETRMPEKSESQQGPAQERPQEEPKVIPMPPRDVKKGADPPKESWER